jgi:hypothetical protein
MSASSFGLGNLVALIDCNGIQADGAIVLDIEPVADKWRAFGWRTREIDGNDMAAITSALAGGTGGRWPLRHRPAHTAGQRRADAGDPREGPFSSASIRASGTP